MRGLVICWMLIGGLGFLIFPWYVTGDGLFSINWILEYSLEDYGSVLPQVFINKKYWLLPLIVPLFFPLFTLKLNQNNPIYSKIFLYSGLFGIFYFILQGFSIGIRGEIFNNDKAGILVNDIETTEADDNTSLTITGSYTSGNLTIKPEIRVDSASAEIYSKSLTDYTDNLASFVLAAIYAF